MSRASSLPRPIALLVAALLAAFALMMAPLSVLPPAGAVEDEATQTAGPTLTVEATEEPVAAEDEAAPADDAAVTDEPPAEDDPTVTEEPGDLVTSVPPAEDFDYEVIGPDSCDSSYNVWVSYLGDPDDAATLRLALQEDDNGVWTTLMTEPFYVESFEGEVFVGSGVSSRPLEEGETATFRVVVYDREAPADITVLDGPVTVTGVPFDEEGCEGEPEPTLPEDQWTLAEADCGSVTFTSRADQEVAVVWYGVEDMESEPTFLFLEPGQSRTFETTEELIFWSSAAGIDENFDVVEGEFALAGEGELEIPQDCPAPPPPPTTGGGGHVIPGKVQTDGGASTGPVALGLALMGLAGAALVRRRA